MAVLQLMRSRTSSVHIASAFIYKHPLPTTTTTTTTTTIHTVCHQSQLLDAPDDEKPRIEAEAGAPSALPKIISTGFKVGKQTVRNLCRSFT
jgi:hypothetical protein